MLNVNKVTSELSSLSDAALQQFAATNRANPYMLSLAVAESNRRKQTRGAAQAGGAPQPRVADQAIAGMAPEATGIGRLPTPGMAAMAGGGIVAFAGDEGSLVERIPTSGYPPAPPSADVARLQELEGMYIPESASGLYAEREELRRRLAPDTGDETARLLKKRPAPVVGPAPAAPPISEAPAGIETLVATSGRRTPGARVRTTPSEVAAPDYPVPSFEERLAKGAAGAEGLHAGTERAFSPLEKLLSEERADLQGRKAGNVKDAIVRAGLGMLGGTSPYAMVNIGKGGVEGLDAYQKAQAMDDAARKANTHSQILLAQAKELERKGNMRMATDIYGQVRQEQQAAQGLKQRSEELKNTKEYQTRHMDILQQQADQAGDYQRMRLATMKSQDLATLKAQQANIQAQLKADPTMQYTNPTVYQELMQDYQTINAALAKQPGGVTMGGTAAPSSAGWGKATVK